MRACLLALIVFALLPVTPLRGEEPPEETPPTAAELEELERLEKLRERVQELEAELERVKAEKRREEEDVLWTVSLASDSKGSGHVADLDGDGTLEIVFGTYFGDEHLYCVDALSGEVEWRYASQGGPFDASVAIADLDGEPGLEILAADSASGHLACLDGKGKELWTFRLPSGTDSPPAVADLDGDGKPEVVIGTMWRRGGPGCVCALDPRTRTLLWEAEVKGCVQSAPALVDLDDDGMLDVVVTSWRGDRGIHAFRGRDGKALWTFITDGDEKSMGMYHGVSVARTGEGGEKTLLLAPTCQGDVYALDAEGKQVWHRHFDEYLFSPGTVADFDGDGKLDLFFAGRLTYMLSVDDGKTKWENMLEGASVERGAAAVDVTGDGTPEVVCSARTRVFVLDGETGRILHERQVAQDPEDRHEKIASAPLVADFDRDGKPDLFVVCGRGYSGDMKEDNHARAWALCIGTGAQAWTTFRGNLHRTGTKPAAPR